MVFRVGAMNTELQGGCVAGPGPGAARQGSGLDAEERHGGSGDKPNGKDQKGQMKTLFLGYVELFLLFKRGVTWRAITLSLVQEVLRFARTSVLMQLWVQLAISLM